MVNSVLLFGSFSMEYFYAECMHINWFINVFGTCVFDAVIVTELEIVLEMLRQEEIPTLHTSSASQFTKKFDVSELSGTSDVFPFKSEDDSPLSSTTNLNSSGGFCQESHLNAEEDEPIFAGTGKT